jgi:hypothetical protein
MRHFLAAGTRAHMSAARGVTTGSGQFLAFRVNDGESPAVCTEELSARRDDV